MTLNENQELVLDLAGDRTKRIHPWSLWRKLRDNHKAVLTGLQGRMSNLKELDSNLCYVGGNPTGKIFQKELVSGSLNVN